MTWRLITEDRVSASFGLAADETLVRRVGVGESPPTLRLYTYRSHCALVGRFQAVENEVHVDFCKAHHVSINRRPTGGGAIIMGADQLGVALTVPAGVKDTYGRARQLMARFSGGLTGALGRMEVQARFRRKNDIEVKGRKIAGLGIYRHSSGGLLFHASLLADLDVPLMLRVLKTPFEKISDKGIDTVAGRISTLRRELGRNVSLNEVRQEVARAYAAAFDITLTRGDFSADERQTIAALETKKYLSEDWIFQSTKVLDAAGSARVKTTSGLLEVRVTLAGRMLKTVYISGDFFAAENAVADVEACLRWHPSDPRLVGETLRRVYRRREGDLRSLPFDALTEAIHSAVSQARADKDDESSDPYGCFVTPGAGHV